MKGGAGPKGGRLNKSEKDKMQVINKIKVLHLAILYFLILLLLNAHFPCHKHVYSCFHYRVLLSERVDGSCVNE